MDDYVISIYFKRNAGKMVGTFLKSEGGTVKLEDAFFEASPWMIFPVIVISEDDVDYVERASNSEVREIRGMATKRNKEQGYERGVSGENNSRVKEGGGENVCVSDANKEMMFIGDRGTEAIDEIVNDEDKGVNGDVHGLKYLNEFGENEKLCSTSARIDENGNSELCKGEVRPKLGKEDLLSAGNFPYDKDEGLRDMVEGRRVDDHHLSVEKGFEERKHDESRDMQKRVTNGEKKTADVDDTTKKKIIIEIEGVCLDDAKGCYKLEENAVTENKGFYGGRCPQVGQEKKAKKEEQLGNNRKVFETGGKKIPVVAEEKNNVGFDVQSTKKGNEGIKKSVTYGWVNKEYESAKKMVDAIKSRFRKVLDVEEGSQKWGTGPSWEICGRIVMNKLTKHGKQQPPQASKQNQKKNSVQKQVYYKS